MIHLAKLVVAVALTTTACSKSSDSPAPEPAPAEGVCVEATGWRYEPISLPPEFAPTLPAGKEVLYFAPGMFDDKSPEHWSYVFSMVWTEPGPRSTGAITTLLDDYYRGLIGAVARGKGLAVDPASVRSSVKAAKDGVFASTVELVDAFGSGAPLAISLDVRVSSDGLCLTAAASAEGDRHSAVWAALGRALACVACP